MRKTAKQLWEEAEEGQAFACQFVPDDASEDLTESPEVIWRKGYDVTDLVWSEILWIAPIEYGERAYR